MSVSVVTCPVCRRSFHSDRPLEEDATLSCPACEALFVAGGDAPPRGHFGLPFVLAVTAAGLLGAGLISAALLLGALLPATRQGHVAAPPEPAAAEDDSARRALEEQRREVERQRREVERDRLLARAEALAAKGQRAAAIAAYDQALKLDPASAAAVEGLVAARAAEAAEQARAGDRRQADAERAAAAERQAAQHKQEAAEAEQARRDEFRKLLAAARAALVGERFADALRDYDLAVRLMPDDLEAQQGRKLAEGKLADLADRQKRQAALADLLDRAEKALAARRYTDALAALAPALRLAPGDREATRLQRAAQTGQRAARKQNAELLARADEAVRLGRLEEAQQLADEAAANWPEDEAARKAAGTAKRLADAAQTSQAAYLRFVQQGVLAMAGSRYAEAVAAYTEALRLAPADLEVQRNLRLARVALERDLRFRTEYERLVRGGTAALARRSFVEAGQAFTQALQLAPDDLVAADGLSKARYGKALLDGQQALTARRRAEAVQAFQAALAERPGDLLARQGLRQAQLLR